MFLNILDTLLLLVIASSTAYIAYHYYRTEQAQADAARYEHRLRLYREVVQFLSALSRDGDISRQALQEFRSRTQESVFLFDQAVADYLDKLYNQASRLRMTNEQLKSTSLPIGDERDRVTVENSKQLIWLADQLPQLHKLFEPYLGGSPGTQEQQRP
ncbi:MAG: hypothetical protein ACYC7L_10600 [Nitrospirota bacterium]